MVEAMPDANVVEELSFLTGLRVYVSEPSPGGHTPSASATGRPAAGPVRVSTNSAGSGASISLSASSATQLVSGLLEHAAAVGASDVHIEPFEDRVRMRLRHDGVLREIGDFPLSQRDSVVARIKVLATLDIAEKRRPQDGRLRYEHSAQPIDVRVSVLPTEYGEKVVMRLLDRSSVILDLQEVGLSGFEHEVFRSAISSPHGMVVVTGPTGSGKTTTLYAALATLNTPSINIVTAEDPVEYDLPGINQVRVRPDIGFGFAEALRTFLRQDPDVIMVGEIRDCETAEVALRAALTGHLVLTTLHTNDASTAVTRLVDMGIEPFLAAASLRLVAAQRLVRKVCSSCASAAVSTATETARLGLTAPIAYQAGSGCDDCSGTGYRGRMALFEVLPVSEEIAEAITTRDSVSRVRAIARAAGVASLLESGLRAVETGHTTPAEILRAAA